MRKKAVFLDRDGVINRLVLNPATSAYESPHTAVELSIFPFAAKSLGKLTASGYLLFLVSNQPSYAKGKTTMEDILAVHDKLDSYLRLNGIDFTEYFYCYHHPQGLIPEYACKCRCRKPSPFFLRTAEKKYHLDMALSWMVGDQDSDIFCGREGGVKTILVNERHTTPKRGKSFPDYIAQDLEEASQIILNFKIHLYKEEIK